MIYLLDVNVLLAASYDSHYLHERTQSWLNTLHDTDSFPCLATCSITELGFVRIACGGANLARNLNDAQSDLARLKNNNALVFLSDCLDASRMPLWVERSKQVTDGHLVELAARHGGILATLDERLRATDGFQVARSPGRADADQFT